MDRGAPEALVAAVLVADFARVAQPLLALFFGTAPAGGGGKGLKTK